MTDEPTPIVDDGIDPSQNPVSEPADSVWEPYIPNQNPNEPEAEIVYPAADTPVDNVPPTPEANPFWSQEPATPQSDTPTSQEPPRPQDDRSDQQLPPIPPTFETHIPAMDPSEERNMALIAHLGIFLNLITGFLGMAVPIVIYFSFKGRSRYVAYQSLQAIIFQGIFFILSGLIAIILYSIAAVLTMALVGICCYPIAIIFSLIPIASLIYAIVAAVDVSNGRDFQYPLVGRWVRKTYEG